MAEISAIYRRNFCDIAEISIFPISRIKFQTSFSIIIFFVYDPHPGYLFIIFKSGNHKNYVISKMRGLENSNKPYIAMAKGSTSPLDGAQSKLTYVALSAREVDDGMVAENGLTRYEGSMVHRALHHRKVP